MANSSPSERRTILGATRVTAIITGLVFLFLMVMIVRSCQQDTVGHEDLDPPRDPLPGAEDGTGASLGPTGAVEFTLPAA